MPKTKLGRPKPSKVVETIWGRAAALGISTPQLAESSGMVSSKLYRRKASPGTFTLDELTRIGRCLDIPIDDLRQCLRY